MTIRSELVFDHESADDSVGSVARPRWVLAGTAVLLTIVIVTAVLLFSEPTTQEGTQVTPAESVVLERPAVDGWEPLTPTAGELRSGFPAPMVWSAGRVCVGFARVDFGPDDFRPSLARCERRGAKEMADNEIRSLVSVTSGLDTWHFIEAADTIDSIKVRLATGEAVDGDRLLLAGSTGALRLENGRDLASIEWSTQSSTYRCVPNPTAWRTSVFCGDQRPDG